MAGALFDKVFCALTRFPWVIRTDRGSEFMSNVAYYLNQALSIRHVVGAAYHASSQGTVERAHRSLSDILYGLSQKLESEWDV